MHRRKYWRLSLHVFATLGFAVIFANQSCRSLPEARPSLLTSLSAKLDSILAWFHSQTLLSHLVCSFSTYSSFGQSTGAFFAVSPGRRKTVCRSFLWHGRAFAIFIDAERITKPQRQRDAITKNLTTSRRAPPQDSSFPGEPGNQMMRRARYCAYHTIIRSSSPERAIIDTRRRCCDPASGSCPCPRSMIVTISMASALVGERSYAHQRRIHKPIG